MARAPIVLTCGEPAGIAPEIAVKARDALRGDLPFVWIGDPRHLPAGSVFEELTDLAQANEIAPRALPVLRHDFAGDASPGTPDPSNAQGVIDVITRAVDLAQSGAASAICTGPIHKAALMTGANFAYPGHTEYLAALAGVDRVVMMLACDDLRVVPTTIHIALRDVADTLTDGLLSDTIRITHAALIRDFGIKNPVISVAGLNPHAGEDGKMGTEDRDLITPVLKRFRDAGMAIHGPESADTMFHAGARTKYDVAICMYHDQALIPIKTLDFSGGVNVTLGLPFVRTSPDHGTAFDIAGQRIADADSLIAALRQAEKMAVARRS